MSATKKIMAPKTDKKYSEVFDAAEKAGQFLQNKKNIIGGLALGATTAPLGLPGNQIVDGIKNTVGNIQAASSFANSNPQIQNILNNEYTGLAAGLNPVTGAAYMFGKGSQLAPVASNAVSNFFETTKTKNPESKKTKTGGNITRVGGKTYRMDNPADVKALEAVLAADKASRPGQKFADLRGGGGMTTQTPPVGPVGPPSPSTDPRNAEYLTERDKLTKDSTAEDIKKVEDIGMTAWAKANPGLASKVKPGQSGYELIKNMSGQGTDAYDANETFKPSDIPEADRQNPVEQAKARGITNLQDAQSFKNTAMDALLTASQDPNVTPIVEGMTIPTTTNYAGAFNQADVPDLQSMMNMGEQLGSLGIEGPKFAQSQKFKDLFQNAMLSK